MEGRVSHHSVTGVMMHAVSLQSQMTAGADGHSGQANKMVSHQNEEPETMADVANENQEQTKPLDLAKNFLLQDMKKLSASAGYFDLLLHQLSRSLECEYLL